MGFAAAGILGVFTTIDWSEIESGVINQGVDILNSLLNNFGVSLEEAEVIEEIRNAIAATSVSQELCVCEWKPLRTKLTS